MIGRLFWRLEVRYKLQIYAIASEKILASAESNPGPHWSVKDKFYEVSTLPSELAGPGKKTLYILWIFQQEYNIPNVQEHCKYSRGNFS